MEFQFCPSCMAYKRTQRIAAYGEQAGALVIGVIMLTWLLSRPAIHWTSWVLAAIVLPMSAYFAWPRKNRARCEGCGKTTAVSEPL